MTNSAATRSNHLQRIWFARRPPFPPRYSLPPLFVKAPFLCRYFHGTRDSQVVSHVWRELCITINLKAVNQYLNHHHPPKCTKNLHLGFVLTRFFSFKLTNNRCFFFFLNIDEEAWSIVRNGVIYYFIENDEKQWLITI